jgi:Phage portal protein/Phage Mu protein F like protein
MATKVPIESGLIARAANNIRAFVNNAWFGPLEPLAPMVTGTEKDSVVGRQWDYPVGINRNLQPRSTDAVSFQQLRGMADACDILRLVIETRKDQMAKLKWKIKPKDEEALPDARCAEIEAFLAFPDKEHDWDTWLRMLLEDLLVIDAPTLYIRKTVGGKLYALEPVDGATVKRILNEQGRTPIPPLPAYQQVLKGVPAIDYTTEELLYKPRNQRTCKIYGYSPVEQIMMTVNIALRRSVHKLQYYTEGNVPEAIVGTPAEWNPDQIALFQKHWDSLHEGNTAERRHMKFVPGKLDIKMTKEEVLKDVFDEWLARIVCFAFSIEPTAFIHQSNRATAESAREAALAEGLAPIMQWVVNLINFIIANHFGYPDLVFDWADEEVQDPLQRAQVNKIYLDAGVLIPDEVRSDLGYDDLTPDQLAQIAAAKAPPPTPLVPTLETQNTSATPGTPGAGGPPEPKAPPPTQKVAKAKKPRAGQVIRRDRPALVEKQAALKRVVAKFLSGQAAILGKKIGAMIAKADDTPEDIAQKIMVSIEIDWDSLTPDMQDALTGIGIAGMTAGLAAVGSDVKPDIGPVEKWAQNRAAEMVGKKWVEGVLVDNPNAEWVITDSTREMIQAYTADAIAQGATTSEFADILQESFAFSDARAEAIARTETAMADMAGQMEGYVQSGVVDGTQWITANDDMVDEECVANAEAGVIPLGEVYPSGDEAPPAHTNCFIGGTIVSAAGVISHYSRSFEGQIFRITIAGNDNFSCTPNHPILTQRGWVAAGQLQITDKLLKCSDPSAFIIALNPNDNHIETRIENVGSSLLVSGGMLSAGVPTTAEAFHGDGVINGEIDIVRAASLLPDDRKVKDANRIEDALFTGRHNSLSSLDSGSSCDSFDITGFSAFSGGIGSGSKIFPCIDVGRSHADEHGVRSIPDWKPGSIEGLPYSAAMATELLSEFDGRFASEITNMDSSKVAVLESSAVVTRLLNSPNSISGSTHSSNNDPMIYAALGSDMTDRLSGLMSFVDIVNISDVYFSGHVYNLETENGWYIANGIVSHNCRCDIIASLTPENVE